MANCNLNFHDNHVRQQQRWEIRHRKEPGETDRGGGRN